MTKKPRLQQPCARFMMPKPVCASIRPISTLRQISSAPARSPMMKRVAKTEGAFGNSGMVDNSAITPSSEIASVVREPSRTISGEDKVSEIKDPIAIPISVSPSSALLTESCTCRSAGAKTASRSTWQRGRRRYRRGTAAEDASGRLDLSDDQSTACQHWTRSPAVERGDRFAPEKDRGLALRPRHLAGRGACPIPAVILGLVPRICQGWPWIES